MFLPQETLLLLALLLPSITHATPLALDLSGEAVPITLRHRRSIIPAFDTSILSPRSIGANAGAHSTSSTGTRLNTPAHPNPGGQPNKGGQLNEGGQLNTGGAVHNANKPNSNTLTDADNNTDESKVPSQNKNKQPGGNSQDGGSDNSKSGDTNGDGSDAKGHSKDEKFKSPEDGGDGQKSSTTAGPVRAAAATGAVSGTEITAIRATASNTQSAVAGPTTTAATTRTAGSSSSGAASGRFDSLSGAFGIGMGMIVVVAAGVAVL